jgi:hypothetical protein
MNVFQEKEISVSFSFSKFRLWTHTFNSIWQMCNDNILPKDYYLVEAHVAAGEACEL